MLTQSCLTLCDPMNCSLPGSSAHEILQARILEWVAISFSRGFLQPRNHTQVSCTAGRFLTNLYVLVSSLFLLRKGRYSYCGIQFWIQDCWAQIVPFCWIQIQLTKLISLDTIIVTHNVLSQHIKCHIIKIRHCFFFVSLMILTSTLLYDF